MSVRTASETSGAPRPAAVRAVLREAFARLAARQGLPVPAGVLVVDEDVPETELVALRARMPVVEDIEDFGYAYESLLGQADRKHAGAHYTPRALADEVVEHALAPLVADREGDALLGLRILDIATGSGIFLVSAARYLAAQPGAPGLRALITSCLYGADVNATAVEVCTLSLWLLAADPDLPVDFLADRVRHGDSLLDEPIGDRTAVDWGTVAPEVLAAGGFDAVIGNPPFLGVKSIRTAVGREVRDHYARTLLDGESGRSDLVVFFLARAAGLSRDVVALVLPDAIAEGDSARFGPGRALDQGYRIYRADTSHPWPGAAGVRIALLWMRRTAAGPDDGGVLDGAPVAWIGPRLGRDAVPGARSVREPPAWMPHGHQATIVLGKALVVGEQEAARLVAADPRLAAWVRPYLSGEDLVSRPGSASSRFVLDLGAVDLATLQAVPALAERLALVRAERDDQLAKYPQLAARWWGFLNPVDRLYDALAGREQAIAFSKHAKYIWPVLVATGPVFSNGTIVYPTDDRSVYAFLASTPHRLWAVDEGGSRLNQSHRYNPSRLRAAYPFPDSFEGARGAGEQLADAVATALAALDLGVTDLLNRVHADAPVPGVVAAVRTALAEVDRAVLAAHGITEAFTHRVRPDGDRTRFGLYATDEAKVKAALVG